MARIPEEEVERLKAEVSVERLAERKGIKLKRHGKDLLGLCPFHEDHSPSLVITPEKNIWHCLGACQAGGSVIDWVMRAEGVSFRCAVELLRADLPSLAAFPTKKLGRQKETVPKHSTVSKLPPLVERSTDDEVLMRQVVDYYHEQLKQSPEALAYLQRRGLVSSEMVEHFRLGLANRTLAYRLPQGNRKTGAEIRGQLQKLGILRQSGHEHFNGSIVIPILDEQGRVVEMYGRKVNDHLREGTPLHLYLPGAHHGVWNVEALQASKQVILCEALIDALTFWCAGYRNVTSAYGVEGFTEEHLAAFKKYGTERVYIAYDRDEAGDRAAEKLAVKLNEAGIECFRVLFPQGMDANEYARKTAPASESLGVVLRQAEWMGRGKPRPASSAPSQTAEPTVAETRSTVATVEPEQAGREPENSNEAETEPTSGPAVGEAEEGPPLPVTPVATAEVAAPQNDSGAEPEKRPDVVERKPEPSVAKRAAIVVDADGVVIEEGGETEPFQEEPALPSPLIPLVEAKPERSSPPKAPAAERRPTGEPSCSQPSEPAPESETAAVEAVAEGEVTFRFGDRRWRVRGVNKNSAPEVMKVNVLVGREGGGFHVDSLELYSARQRAMYIDMASAELGIEKQIIKRELGAVLLKLEELQEKRLKPEAEDKTKRPVLSEKDKSAALELLRDPNLLDRILADFERCGVVGEQTNKLVGYLAATSRKLDEPLAVVIQSSSAAGKSSLMDAVLNLMPEEERTQYSAMTGQSLFYMSEMDIRHRILAIVEEEGAERAAYALKLLQSEGELTIASTGKDPATGRLVTQEYRVEGPVMIFLTTTAIEVDEELLNRCMVLTVDEGRAQTQAIHARQRMAQTLEGILARREKDQIVKLHRDVQRMLRPLTVVNPYAQELKFLDHATRTRRDHKKYLTLIQTIALLHQYQRATKTVEHRGQHIEYIEVSRSDIEIANKLCDEVLGRSLDELPPQTRRLLGLITEMVESESKRQGVAREDFRFSRRQVRDYTSWGNTQIKVHLGRLLEMEYVLAHRGTQGQSFFYELSYDGRGQDGRRFVPGLIGARTAASNTKQSGRGAEPTSRGVKGDFAGASRPSVGGESVGGWGAEIAMLGRESGSMSDRKPSGTENTHRGTGRTNGLRAPTSSPALALAASARSS